MVWQIKLERRAREELDEALQWYGEIHPYLRQSFFYEYRHTRKRLEENPYLFAVLEGELRRANFSHRFPYSLIFIIEDRVVRIFAVFHHSRKPLHGLQ